MYTKEKQPKPNTKDSYQITREESKSGKEEKKIYIIKSKTINKMEKAIDIY